MKTLSLVLLFTLSAIAAFSQKKAKMKDDCFTYKNSAQLELLGHGLLYSFNYERNLLNYNHFKTSFQAGVSFYPAPIDIRSRLWVPISFNQLFSLKQHHLELGLGFVLTQFQNYSDGDGRLFYKDSFDPLMSAKIGYRYQKPDGRMHYKVLFTPLLEQQYGQYDFHPWGGITVGYNF